MPPQHTPPTTSRGGDVHKFLGTRDDETGEKVGVLGFICVELFGSLFYKGEGTRGRRPTQPPEPRPPVLTTRPRLLWVLPALLARILWGRHLAHHEGSKKQLQIGQKHGQNVLPSAAPCHRSRGRAGTESRTPRTEGCRRRETSLAVTT